MRIEQPKATIFDFNSVSMLRMVERAARTCYRTEGKMGEYLYDEKFIKSKLDLGHLSVIEHEKITVLIVCDRGISHEVVRHRLAAYSQESTRYCCYSKDKFGNEITVIEPFFFIERGKDYQLWEESCLCAERNYMAMLDNNCSAQEARSVLPNSLKTEIVVTYNLREWRHFFTLRCAKPAHPQIKQIAIPLLFKMQEMLPIIFDDISVDQEFLREHSQYFAEIKVEEI